MTDNFGVGNKHVLAPHVSLPKSMPTNVAIASFSVLTSQVCRGFGSLLEEFYDWFMHKDEIEAVRLGHTKETTDIRSVFYNAIESNAFYKDKFDSYFKFLPGIVAHMESLAAAEIAVQEPLELELVKQQLIVFQKLPVWSSELPPGTTDNLVNGMVKQAQSFGNKVLESEEKTEELIHLVQKLVHEASILDSMNEHLVGLHSNLGDAVVQCRNNQAYADLQRLAADAEGKLQADAPHDQIAAAIQAMQQAHNFNVAMVTVPSACMHQLKKTTEGMMAFLEKAVLKTTLPDSTLMTCLQYAVHASSAVSENGKAWSSCPLLECLLEVKLAHNDLCGPSGLVSAKDLLKDKDLPSLSKVSRLLLKASALWKDLQKECPDHGCQACFTSIHNAAKESLQQLMSEVAKAALDGVEAPLKKLKLVSNGCTDGSKWLEKEKWNKIGFKELLEQAKKTILSLDLKGLCASVEKVPTLMPYLGIYVEKPEHGFSWFGIVNTLQGYLHQVFEKAWTFYQHVLELQSLECPNAGLHDDIQTTVVSAKVTRLLGLLFTAYIKEPSNIQKQRAAVQPILQELRGLVGPEKEKEVVPHYLFDKARKTLNLQKQA
eukprot:6481262-Amphidinium_carterae.1